MPRLTRLSIPWRELPLLTVGECAEVLGVHRSVVDGMVSDGQLSTRTIGKERRVETASVIAWVDRITPERAAQRRRPSPSVKRAAAGLGIGGVR